MLFIFITHKHATNIAYLLVHFYVCANLQMVAAVCTVSSLYLVSKYYLSQNMNNIFMSVIGNTASLKAQIQVSIWLYGVPTF